MTNRRLAGLAAGTLAILAVSAVVGGGKPSNVVSPEALSARIDHWFSNYWKEHRIEPAPVADDAEFIRRVYLDLVGRIPNIIEVRDFLDDPAPEKRRLWVEKLLGLGPVTPDNNEREKFCGFYADHFNSVWRELLLPDAGNSENLMLRQRFEEWLHFRLRENAGYDRMVRELLSLPSLRDNAQVAAFYEANERKPENVAATAARLFMGMKLECAQCHNHPFAKWKKEDFWGFTAFFADIQPRMPAGQGSEATVAINELKIPGTDQVARPRFPNALEPLANPGERRRQTLAEWLTSAQNPYFARAGVNMLWGYLLGHGLIEPADEAGEDHPSDHGELINDLARQWAAHQFDLKFLIRGIIGSRVYQLTSAAADRGPHAPRDGDSHAEREAYDPQSFARMAVRSLTAEQLFDSVAEVCRYGGPDDRKPRMPGRMNGPTPRDQFRDRFTGKAQRTESETTILQALFLMNGGFMADATSLEKDKNGNDKNGNLATIAVSAAYDARRRIETIYLVTFSRKPRTEEAARLLRYIEAAKSEEAQRKALTDIQWALLNSAEFRVNH